MGECLECGEWVGSLPPAHSGGSGIIRAFQRWAVTGQELFNR